MNAWCILGIVLAVLALLLALPVGVRAVWNGTLLVCIRVGPLRLQVFPLKEKKEKKPEKEEEPKAQKPKKKRPSLCLEQLLYTVEAVGRLLGKLLRRFYRGLRLDPLRLRITAAGPDPADAAVLYGRLYAVIASLLPAARELIPIQNEDVTLLLDFGKSALEIEADVGVYLRLGHILGIGLTALGGVIGWAWGFKKRAKPAKPAPAEEAKVS